MTTSGPQNPSPDSYNANAGSPGSLPTLPIRTVSAEELDAYYESLQVAFNITIPPEEAEFDKARLEPARTIAAFDGEAIVGTAGAFSFRLSVPGGEVVPVAAVTMVSVAPTHRRRGLLRGMMRHQLDDVRERGESLAVLVASEGVIYGRFGYGLATSAVRASVPRRRVRIQDVPGIDGYRLRLADPAESLDACERIYAALVPGRPGMLERRPGWERIGIIDPERGRDGARPLQAVLAERVSDGEVVGYARYAAKANWEDTGPEGRLRVRDIEALEPAAYAALLRFLLSTDLVREVDFRSLPVDDPLFALVSDWGPVTARLDDGLYVRTVDVGGALAARRYAAEVDVVLDVADEFCPWNAGRWRLSAGPKGAVCERTTDAAELRLTARELGAAYLGGFTLRGLADAGRVEELVPGAVGAASAAFRGERGAWLPHGF